MIVYYVFVLLFSLFTTIRLSSLYKMNTANQIRNCIKLLDKVGFVRTQDDRIAKLNTLGMLLKRNLFEEMHKFHKGCDFPVFPVIKMSDMNTFIKPFLNENSLHHNGLALITDEVVQLDSKKKEETFLWETKSLNLHRLALFCSQNTSLNQFHWMQSQRYIFWRSLSQFPTNFSLHEMQKDIDASQQLSIDFLKDGLSIPIERISLVKKGAKQFLPIFNEDFDVILCDTYVESALSSLLLDAHVVRESGEALLLNEDLVPYQVALALASFTTPKAESKELLNYLYKLVRNLDISTYPFLYSGSMNSSFESLDQMGVLYTVMVDESCLNKGLVFLRNRNTEIMV